VSAACGRYDVDALLGEVRASKCEMFDEQAMRSDATQ
jgi:hypothetical protein